MDRRTRDTSKDMKGSESLQYLQYTAAAQFAVVNPAAPGSKKKLFKIAQPEQDTDLLIKWQVKYVNRCHSNEERNPASKKTSQAFGSCDVRYESGNGRVRFTCAAGQGVLRCLISRHDEVCRNGEGCREKRRKYGCERVQRESFLKQLILSIVRLCKIVS